MTLVIPVFSHRRVLRTSLQVLINYTHIHTNSQSVDRSILPLNVITVHYYKKLDYRGKTTLLVCPIFNGVADSQNTPLPRMLPRQIWSFCIKGCWHT